VTEKLELVASDNPILYTPTIPFDFETQNAQETFETLKQLLSEMKGYGLSANQVGLPWAVFVFGNGRDSGSIMPMFNPKIVSVSSEKEGMDEGCLSFPGLIAKVERHKTITVQYQNIDGDEKESTLSGLTARIIQHEMCHIDGKPFFAGFSKLKIDMMVKKCAKRTGITYSTNKLMGLRK
jgi:peptide deformylase